ncbi:hypothetical protein GHNINEIG_01068 [Hydrogenovibrio crunogenus]|uniref:Phage protein n=1 Tax=Hydrogenovibrio crunogenus TaxID=39765 RepID=A0A4P7NZ46_9GAMM|nr:hypothetical protein [Hydrogenovibrio crunogenus]QBZ83027.1 hypothetical protein GHNINEIG_01068 [Hydrogenovibrio crunogenus]
MENIIYQTLVTILIAAFTGYVTFRVQERRLKQELKTEFMAEKVAKKLLSEEKWKKRSFSEIKKRLGGFEDDELRKVLVRSGAVRFERNNGTEELWGLISKNKDEL